MQPPSVWLDYKYKKHTNTPGVSPGVFDCLVFGVCVPVVKVYHSLFFLPKPTSRLRCAYPLDDRGGVFVYVICLHAKPFETSVA